MKTYLAIPAEDEGRALTLGAMLDPASGQYFVPSGTKLSLFQAWLPAEVTPGALATAKTGISLSELLSRIGTAIDRAFPRPEWVRIEISDLNSKNGHVYLDAVDRDASGNALSKSRAVIWRSEAHKIGEKFFKATGIHLADGMKVLVLVQPQFKGQYGLSLTIADIDPNFTLGDMEARLKRIRERLKAEGDADKNRNLPAPVDFARVAVISPEGAAGLGDFQAEASRLANAGLCTFTYVHATFQGDKAKESLKQAFIDVHTRHEADPFDALAVIRGGGAAADLHWLNEYVIAKMVCRFRCPVFTGIGHERDSTILDEYANRHFGTPSKVIGHIKEAIATRANKALEDWMSICQSARSALSAAEARIEQCHRDIAARANAKTDRASFAAANSYNDVQHNALSAIAVTAEKVDALHAASVDAALTALDIAQRAIGHVSATINDRALAAINAIDIQTQHDFDAITLAARRSIDGIEEHLGAHWRGILGNTTALTKNLAAASNRHFADVRHCASKMMRDADEGAKELMSSILAHGVEPTLRRGFAIVKSSDGTPIATKAAAAAEHNLEIIFRDGSLLVNTGKE